MGLFSKKKKDKGEYKCIRTINLFSEKLYKEGDHITYEEWAELPMIVRVYHFEGPWAPSGSQYKAHDYTSQFTRPEYAIPDFEKPESKGKHHIYPHKLNKDGYPC